MKTEDKRVLVDTNILIYFNFKDSPFYKQAANKLKYYRKNNFSLCVTTQIIREFLVNTTRLLKEMDEYPIEGFENKVIQFFKQFSIYSENELTIARLIHNIIKYNLTGNVIHDTNIVSVMQCYNIPHILTHNVNDFKKYKDITIISLT